METDSRTDSEGGNARPGRAPRARAAGRFLGSHPIGILQALFFGAVAIVVLQNLEPTTFDVLFWSTPEVPRLVGILVAMGIGGLLWELVRRRLSR